MLAVLVLAPLALIESLDQFSPIAQTNALAKESLSRLNELAQMRSSQVEPLSFLPLPDRWDLEADNLRVGWRDELDLPPLNFTVGEGDVVGIAGPSGSGKSTLAWTLLGLIGPKSGRIELGGADTRFVRGADLRGRIGLMEQDSHMFDTSIRENLRIGMPDAGDDEMTQALTAAGLAAFVRSLPKGLGTIVGENGSRLSGGERQRLALARLLLADRAILIFDEPTEPLDEVTAEGLIDDILRSAPEHTVMVISHSQAILDQLPYVVRLEEPELMLTGPRS